MAYSAPYDSTRPTTVGRNDAFGDGERDEPFSVDHLTYDDSRTFTTYTSGVPAVDLARPMPETGPTEAESLAAVYRQYNISPSLSERPSRLPTPSPYEIRSSNPAIRDEDSYSSHRPASVVGKADTSLIDNAADMGRSLSYQDLEYAEPPREDPKLVSESSTPFRGLLGTGKYPIEQRIEDKKRGIVRQKYPFVVYVLTIVMVGVFINELVVNSRAQGTPVSFKPVVNPMLGPSGSALINLGARFPPCMKSVENLSSSSLMACLNDTANPPDILCTIEEVCGFGGFKGGAPDQWFRFITAIFLHAGFVHILLNMLVQLTVSAQIEREMGSAGFFITYFAAGIFGNILGGNFSLVGAPSVGASGAIFGTVAVTWVDLFAHWQYHYRPGRKLAWMTVELLFGIALGYVPYVDNFAHLGGLCMGLLVGTTLYPVVSPTKRHKAIMWAFRLAAIPLAVVLFVVLIRNFYTSDPYAGMFSGKCHAYLELTCSIACSGCRYLSCIPTSSNNHCQGTGQCDPHPFWLC
ncbi:rhomboid-domain-containing protein [Gyrodon lividus]|nr:rhomboid-domain-containing protein [Gyrodon lividus]